MQFLEQSTAASVMLGPMLDDTNGFSPENGLTIAQADIRLSKNGGVFAQKNDATSASVAEFGWYNVEFDTTDTNTLGRLMVAASSTGALPVWREFMVVNANVYDSLFDPGTDRLQVDATQWNGTAVATPTQAGVPEVDITFIAGVAVSTTTAQLGVNMVQISEDATSADNLELQYDTTGLTGATFPSTQAQLDGIALTGAAINTLAESYTLTTGTESSGSVSSTEALDSSRHEHTDTSGSMDLYYQFDIGGDGTPTSVTMTGRVNGNNDDLEVSAYNWSGSTWDQIGTQPGTNSSIDSVETYTMFTSHVGAGVDLGKARIRFTDGTNTLTTATLRVDQIYISYAVVSRTIGYADGAIWVDTNASNTNTELHVDGVADNPVSTWAAALTISGNLNIVRFRIKNGSTITLTGNSDNYTLIGETWTLALGGQSISGAAFAGANVTGTGTGASEPQFLACHIGNVTLPPSEIDGCGIEATFTIGSAGAFHFDSCHSGVAGTAAPILDFGSGLNSSDVYWRSYSGGIEIQNMGAGTGSYNMSLEGWGQLIINANCSATSTVSIRGNFTVTDNASGAVTLSDEARFDVEQVTGGTYALDTDANGRIRIVDGTGTGEIDTSSGAIAVVNSIAASGISASSITAGAIDAAAIAASAIGNSELSATGTALTSIPWNAAWDAEVQSEVTDSLIAHNLDHLALTATAGSDMTTEVADNTVFSRLMANGDTSVFNPSTDGLQPLRDRGDAAWVTATTVDLNADQSSVTIGTVNSIAASGISASSITASAIDAAAIAASAIGDSELSATGTALTSIPWNASWDTEVQSEVTDSLVAHNLDHLALTATGGADMTSEVADNTILSRVLANGDTSAFTPSTDGLQPIRDRGDAAWITATAVDLNADQSAATIGTVNSIAASGISASSLAAGAIHNAAYSASAISASILDIDAAQLIADTLLERGISNVDTTADATSLAALVLAAFESSISGSTWTIRRTGGATFDTRDVTLDGSASPITGVT